MIPHPIVPIILVATFPMGFLTGGGFLRYLCAVVRNVFNSSAEVRTLVGMGIHGPSERNYDVGRLYGQVVGATYSNRTCAPDHSADKKAANHCKSIDLVQLAFLKSEGMKEPPQLDKWCA